MNHLYFGDCLDVLKEITQQHPQLPGAADNQPFKKAQKKESKGGSYGLFD